MNDNERKIFREKAEKNAPETKKFFAALKRKTPRNLDDLFHEAHQDEFEKTDCLQCANCCKTTSPIFYMHDIERVAKKLKIKTGTFIDTYLHLDSDGDYVLNQAPCPFLDQDNYCTVYDARPTACREYPHTDRKRIVQILDLTYQNTFVCPAVFRIVERIKTAIK